MLQKIDIRKTDKKLSFRNLWLASMFEKLRADPDMTCYTNEELKAILLEKYKNRRVSTGRFYNNTTQENYKCTTEEFINIFLNKPYILSGYACLYENQDNSVNISSAALAELGNLRKFNKKKMEAAEHGSDEYIYYRILQLTYKVLMNSYYGILGEKNSVFYNPFVQNSITTTGQDLITTSIIGMEAFVKNNVPFENTDQVLTFLMNVKDEKPEFNILDYVDLPISQDQILKYLRSQMKPGKTMDESIIIPVLSKLSPEQLTRAYYKNQYLKLLSNMWFKNKLSNILKYNYFDKPDSEMVDDLNDLKSKVIDFSFYDCLYEDRYKRAMKDKRRAIITIDTDSNFINANPSVEYITDLLHLDKANKNQQTTVVNIIINIVTETLKRTFWTLTTNMGLIDDAKPIINMKQEFLYSKILLTKNKKNYAGIVSAELGKLLDTPVIDIKGLPILKKTSVPRELRKRFTSIVENDILKSDKIDIKGILKKYDDISKTIEESIRNGNTEYLLPKNAEIFENYKSPDTMEQIRAIINWNKLEPENQIIPPSKIDLIKLDCETAEDPRLNDLKEKHPDKYDALIKTAFTAGNEIDYHRFGFDRIAIPKGTEHIPDYILPFIDYKGMVNTNMAPSYILLESLGVYCATVRNVKYKSNIIAI